MNRPSDDFAAAPDPDEPAPSESTPVHAAHDAPRSAPLSPDAADAQAASRSGPGITRRGVLIGLVIGVVAIITALTSLYVRRTRLERTTAFWGRPVIRALQASSHIRVRVPPGSSLEMAAESENGAVELADVPGVSHLRHALLDERHFQWTTLSEVSVEASVEASVRRDGDGASDTAEGRAVGTEWVVLELEGTPPGVENEPEGAIQPATILLELSTGWVGLAGGDRSVRLTPRVRPAIRHFLATASNVRSKHYDLR